VWWTRKKGDVSPFLAPRNDELAAEHRVVSDWVEEAWRSVGGHAWYQDVELKTQPAGRQILESAPDQTRRYVHAAAIQAAHWDRLAAEHRARGKSDFDLNNPHLSEGWAERWGRRRHAANVVSTLMRRALPFEERQLVGILDWCNAAEQRAMYDVPAGHIARALERYLDVNPLTDALRERVREFAAHLRESFNKDIKRYATAVEQLLADSRTGELAVADAGDESVEPPAPPPEPAPAGNAAIFDVLKRHIGIAHPAVATQTIGPDEFPLREDSPLKTEHALLTEMITSVVGTRRYSSPDLTELAGGSSVLRMDPVHTGYVLLAAAERDVAALFARSDVANPAGWQSRSAVGHLAKTLARRPFALDRNGLFDFLLYVAMRATPWDRRGFDDAFGKLLAEVEQEAGKSPLKTGERYVLHLLRTSWIEGPPLGTVANEITRLTALVGDHASFFLVPGEAWTDHVNDDLARVAPREREPWLGVLRHALTATAARPSAKWLKAAGRLVSAIGEQRVAETLQRWMSDVPQGRTVGKLGTFLGDPRSESDVMQEENGTCLRGLVWLTPLLPRSAVLSRAVATVALSSYRKVPGVGPRAVKVANAAVYALSEMPTPESVGHLAMLKVRVKSSAAQNEIGKAFAAAAEALSLPRDQIEEMAVPTYGLEDIGVRREIFANGEFTAEIRVEGREVDIHWTRTDGKPQKSVPAKVKSESKGELKELQGAAKDITAMLSAQSERLDAMFLLQKTWPVGVWRERYLDHPLVGTIARRLIWNIRHSGTSRTGIWNNDRMVDAGGQAVDLVPDAEVELWHPIDQSVDDVLAWRRWVEGQEIRQPFKQAHREVYLLTDAERNTETYSNRFAAHILRQHQFNALCAARGWKNKLRMMVDDVYPPATREVSNWGLRAEYWIEGAGDHYGTDTNESGAYLRVVTDQVRFYHTAAASNRAHAGGGGYTTQAAGPGERDINVPLSLAEIPPLVFSEIMRDVDLFVGVASVGNDPTWQDGGPGGRYRDYWTNYSFGELGETAKTRRAILEQLVPRLKIGAQCTLTERFLVVRGKLRSYKIHLGSGNVLMEPNDQYLCIVPARGVAAGSADRLFLPFEGDSTLSIVLSKAFLLAADDKIKDPTIVRQIR